MQANDFRGPPVEDRSEIRRVGRARLEQDRAANLATCSKALGSDPDPMGRARA